MNVLVPAAYSDAFVEDPTPVLLPKQTLHLDHATLALPPNQENVMDNVMSNLSLESFSLILRTGLRSTAVKTTNFQPTM